MEQKLEAALDVIRSMKSRMGEMGRQNNYLTRRNLDLAAEADAEREITNHVLRDIGKCLKLAGVEGVKITVNRSKKLTVVEVADRKIQADDGKTGEAPILPGDTKFRPSNLAGSETVVPG